MFYYNFHPGFFWVAPGNHPGFTRKTAKIDFSLHLITFNDIKLHASFKSICAGLQNIKLIKYSHKKNEPVLTAHFLNYLFYYCLFNFHLFLFGNTTKTQ